MGEKLMLQNVTPRTMRVLKKMGILTTDTNEYLNVMSDIYTDEKKLRELCETIFVNPPTDLENVDLAEVEKGVKGFFRKVFGGSPN
jgi:hypothetical protein